MFMFQNGLLVSFIPEILMVIGYVLCLLTPAFKPQQSIVEPCATVVHVSTIEHSHISTYQSTFSEYQAHVEFVEDTKQQLTAFVQKRIPILYQSTFRPTEGLSYVDFSRPPPCFLS